MSVAGGVSQFLLKWFIGFRTSICKMESITIEKMQTFQVAFSITFRISPLLLHPALLMPVEVLPWISNLIGPKILSSLGQLRCLWTSIGSADTVMEAGLCATHGGSFALKYDSFKFRRGTISGSNKQKSGIGTVKVMAVRLRLLSFGKWISWWLHWLNSELPAARWKEEVRH